MHLPVIKLEIEGVKHAVLMALQQHQIDMDAHVKQALDVFCSDEHIASVVNAAARDALTNAIKSEVNNYFTFGPGRAAVKEAVTKRLEEYKEWG